MTPPEAKTYSINLGDKIRVENSLHAQKREIEKENKKLLEKIESNKKSINNLDNTILKISGMFYHDKEPKIYNEKLKGVWEGIKR